MSRTNALMAAIKALPPQDGPLFAVLDGAQFDNLPDDLLLGKFVSRPLYLDRGDNDPQRVITAPHMVWLDEREESIIGRGPDQTLPALLELIGDRPAAAVFWRCKAGGEALFRHLRGLNMVMVPKTTMEEGEEQEPAEGEEGEEGGAPAPAENDTHGVVLFRHADANVMAQIMPGLLPAEMSRLYGPADLIICSADAKWTGGVPVVVAHRPAELLPPAPGMMRFSDDAVRGIDSVALAASRATITDYLRQTAPEYTEKMSEAELSSVIIEAERVGDEIGLTNERSHGLWAFLALITGGETLRNQMVLSHFKTGEKPADDLVEDLVNQIADASEEELEAYL